MWTSASEFIGIARAVQQAAGDVGLLVPAFRSRSAGQPRGLQRHPSGVVVYVPRAQDPHDVARDCIIGVLTANRLPAGHDVEAALWSAVDIP